MKSYIKPPKGRGYCCRRCDGPYRSWKKKVLKGQKSSVRHAVKKEIEKQLED